MTDHTDLSSSTGDQRPIINAVTTSVQRYAILPTPSWNLVCAPQVRPLNSDAFRLCWNRGTKSNWLSKAWPLPGPANTRRWTDVDLMLAQRRRRWASSKSTLVQCLVFAGLRGPCVIQKQLDWIFVLVVRNIIFRHISIKGSLLPLSKVAVTTL